jgi:transcription elongation factor Elf1
MLELKYITLISSRLRNFKRKGNLLNFSCPLCGDSENKKSKARAYVYQKKDKWLFHCHNCGAAMTAANFIKTMDQGLYSEFVIESLKSNRTEEQNDLQNFVNKMKPVKYADVLKGLKKVSQLSPDHPVKKLVTQRKIPTNYHHKIYACPNFMEFTNKFIPNKFDSKALNYDEMRLLIPFISSTQEIHAFQGRSVNKKSEVRYITIVISELFPKVYGLDTVNFNLPVPVFEGPIDSMFVDNSIATAGGDLGCISKFDRNKLIVVFDNEPRSPETVKKYEKAIYQGYKVCIWPSNIEQKDVNDMILAGYTKTSVEHIIYSNTYNELSAKMALTNWKKI